MNHLLNIVKEKGIAEIILDYKNSIEIHESKKRLHEELLDLELPYNVVYTHRHYSSYSMFECININKQIYTKFYEFYFDKRYYMRSTDNVFVDRFDNEHCVIYFFNKSSDYSSESDD